MDTMLNELEFASAYLDDIMLRRENNEQHNKYIKVSSEVQRNVSSSWNR